MPQKPAVLKVIWETIPSPDAQQRIEAAFAMLLSPLPSRKTPEQDLDS